jgi:Protein of unknown function (DUF2851)
MKEDFLHYLWKFQKFSKVDLQTTSEESIRVLSVGNHNFNAGPDFLMAQVEIGRQLWVGQIEIHLQSSQWYDHHHQKDANYDNVILHVVWEHDMEVIRKDNTAIPTLVLKDRVLPEMVHSYHQLFAEPQRFIACENHFPKMEGFLLNSWLWRMFIERLQLKSEWILQQLKETGNNWESVLFRLLIKTFGSQVNGESFLSIATSVDYSVIKKCSTHPKKLEALLYGQAGWLETRTKDPYIRELQTQYTHLKSLYHISQQGIIQPKFFRLRPSNFPTLRLAQFSALWSNNPYLFSVIVETTKREDLYALFQINLEKYWDTHYKFSNASPPKKKKLSKSFIDLILINVLIPLKFTYGLYHGNDPSEEVTDLALALSGEKNNVVLSFQKISTLGNSAWHSQSLLHLKKAYCENFKCMNCEVGNFIFNMQREPMHVAKGIFEWKNASSL